MTCRIFMSSVQREFSKERKALADYIRKDRLFGCFQASSGYDKILSALEG